MHYIKQFNINGVDTKQVACIELQGKPNAATEGAIGVLGMDMLSPTHDVYRCVAVNGSVYTWELLSAGMSIMSATITWQGAMSATFPYSRLIVPNNYIIKVGDLILDREGYLYQITSIDSSSCTASYCDTHIGGIASGDKDRRLVVKNGKLRLVTEGGSVLSEVDYEFADDSTIYRNPSSGRISAIGIKTINGNLLRFFVGEQSEYDSLTDVQKTNLFAIITDDEAKEKLIGAVERLRKDHDDLAKGLTEGTFVVKNATNATNATKDGEGNIIVNTYKRKDQAMIAQDDFYNIYHTDENSSIYYLNTTIGDSVKTLDEIIGISGKAHFTLPGLDGLDDVTYTFTFTSFYKDYDGASNSITFGLAGLYFIGRAAQMFSFNMYIQANRRVLITQPTQFNVTERESPTVKRVDITGLSIFLN